MSASIGPDDVSFLDSPRTDVLREISGIDPVEAGTHVLLEEHGVRSTQRLALGVDGGRLVAALWPAELKEQAIYLYGQRLARPMIDTARRRGWTAVPSPHIGFRNSQHALRLYMAPEIDALEYARRWQEGDLEWVGAHPRAAVRRRLWPWLKSRGYAEEDDDDVLEEWLRSCLGKRDAFMRAGLRLRCEYRLDTSAAKVRADVAVILAAADEPPLPPMP